MIAKDLIEALLGHDLSKKICFEVELTNGAKCEVEINGVTARNHSPNERSGSPRLIITGDEVHVVADVKLEVQS